MKRTPADVQSTRYQVQAQSYVQMNSPENENHSIFNKFREADKFSI